jgi:glycosyltransferase involved in cell wall biosynthesis
LKKPLVSIITPFFNADKYLGDAINSVLSQTYPNWELLLIDDGSTDNSYAVAQSFKDPRVKLMQQANGGQCVATNNAIRIAQGDFIQLLDADDLMHPLKTEHQVRDLIDKKEFLGVSRWAFFYDDPSDALLKEEPVFFSGNVIDWLYALWGNDTMMHTNSYMMSRSLLDRGASFFDESLKLNVDFEFFTRMALASKGVIYTDDAIGYYRKGVKGSKTHNASISKQLSALDARVKSIRYLLNVDSSDKAKQAARMALTILTFSYPALLPHSKSRLEELGLDGFASFGGKRFKAVSSLLGFENTIRLKRLIVRG